MRLLLASRSPARRATLEAAGMAPTIEVSQIDEDALFAECQARQLPYPAIVGELARAKAEDVAARHLRETGLVVLGCDSMFELDGVLIGKPGTALAAQERLRIVRGRTGFLHTGHYLIRTDDGAAAGATASTAVTFADLTDAEIDAYVATGEPIGVAGGFTVDGFGGPFIEGINGDHHNVVGVSLPLLRKLLDQLDLTVMALWESACT
jgi:septum formation protein